MEDLLAFFADKHFYELYESAFFQVPQIGAQIMTPINPEFSLEEADIVIVGCGEYRSEHPKNVYNDGPNAIRQVLYSMHLWHEGVKLADLGNLKEGASVKDTQAALSTVLQELYEMDKIVLVLGGAHDLMLQAYTPYQKAGKLINVANVDMLIDLEQEGHGKDRTFLHDLLTGEPNYVERYMHLAFQSYYCNPRLIETVDKLNFDFVRLGRVKESLEEIEPFIRHSHIMGFDISAIKYADAPANTKGSPNGLNGEEACTLTKYAGLSTHLQCLGIYGYKAENDQHGVTAQQIAQMVWYFIDGVYMRKREPRDINETNYTVYYLKFAEVETQFFQSYHTGRWWMTLPNGTKVPCSFSDYLKASQNDIPDRWFREVQRMV
jgi:formiminoglutamase